MNSILAINSGSSSLKFGLFVKRDGDEHALVQGDADAIGSDNGSLKIKDEQGKSVHDEQQHFASQKEALAQVAKTLASLNLPRPAAIGHRVVHGGPRLVEHQRITGDVLSTLQQSVHFAPLHIPAAIEIIRHVEKLYPGTPQFACFDTAFHQSMPEAAYRFAIPAEYSALGVRRYGFHGLSYASIVHALGSELPPRLVAAHLGNGASLSAIANGKSVDTSMGLTPAGGIPMGSRTGDLDPGVLLFLMRNCGPDVDALEFLLNHNAGLKALGGTNDMRQLQAGAEAGDDRAALAIEVFCRSTAKTIAGYASVLDGIDMLVFSGGIGEHSALVRANVCRRLEFLCLTLDAARNHASASTISTDASPVTVRIMPSEEEKQIARTCRALLSCILKS